MLDDSRIFFVSSLKMYFFININRVFFSPPSSSALNVQKTYWIMFRLEAILVLAVEPRAWSSLVCSLPPSLSLSLSQVTIVENADVGFFQPKGVVTIFLTSTFTSATQPHQCNKVF